MNKEIVVKDGFNIIMLDNNSSEIKTFQKEVDSTFIKIHFSIKNK